MSVINGHTCIGDDGGTSMRKCRGCEAERKRIDRIQFDEPVHGLTRGKRYKFRDNCTDCAGEAAERQEPKPVISDEYGPYDVRGPYWLLEFYDPIRYHMERPCR